MADTLSVDPRPSTLWHGLAALAEHMRTHQLPPFGELDYEDQHLTVHLAQADAEAWQASIHVDAVDVEDAVTGGLRELVLMTGRLPDTGVRVHLSWYRSKTCQSSEPVALAKAVAEVVTQLDPKRVATCDDCGIELDVTHGVERGQALCEGCCQGGNPCSWRACCAEGAIR